MEVELPKALVELALRRAVKCEKMSEIMAIAGRRSENEVLKKVGQLKTIILRYCIYVAAKT